MVFILKLKTGKLSIANDEVRFNDSILENHSAGRVKGDAFGESGQQLENSD